MKQHEAGSASKFQWWHSYRGSQASEWFRREATKSSSYQSLSGQFGAGFELCVQFSTVCDRRTYYQLCLPFVLRLSCMLYENDDSLLHSSGSCYLIMGNMLLCWINICLGMLQWWYACICGPASKFSIIWYHHSWRQTD